MPPSVDEGLLENAFVSVRRTIGIMKLIRVVRTTAALDTLEQVDEAWGGVSRVLAPIDRSRHVLLIDMRSAPGRNDDAFERRVAPYRAATVHGFPRVAVLVKSVPGQLQVQRHVREDGLGEVQIFVSEHDAIEWLASAAPPPSTRPSKRPSRPA
jgi:hypothetical protein